MSEEAKWYVVHTYSGYENKVKEDLEKTVENRNLQDMILEVKYPTEEVVEIKDAKRKVVQRKVYPGYVMIKMIMKQKNVDSLPVLIETARQNGVKLLACQMTMDLMGIKREELLDGIDIAGVATMVASSDESNATLFI